MSNSDSNSRFKDQNLRLTDFCNHIFVHCPKCDEKAVIKKDDPSDLFSPVNISCFSCSFFEKNDLTTYDAEIKTICTNCSERLNTAITGIKNNKEILKIKCPFCSTVQECHPKYRKVKGPVSIGGNAIDPYLGFPLWLKGIVKGNIFWAYNYEHLTYLKKYVSAKLRERNNREHFTLVEKLPDWIKSAKNRESILKSIAKIEKM